MHCLCSSCLERTSIIHSTFNFLPLMFHRNPRNLGHFGNFFMVKAATYSPLFFQNFFFFLIFSSQCIRISYSSLMGNCCMESLAREQSVYHEFPFFIKIDSTGSLKTCLSDSPQKASCPCHYARSECSHRPTLKDTRGFPGKVSSTAACAYTAVWDLNAITSMDFLRESMYFQ